ncbi:unnamed protein product, partial [Symbiodinium pilosum]
FEDELRAEDVTRLVQAEILTGERRTLVTFADGTQDVIDDLWVLLHGRGYGGAQLQSASAAIAGS